mmetsp:Transcript_6848/g.16813  ORF Transcript_6848/g.16813 Transcript_6848/m.16813 type:complete len:464 (-) Transcript_6848:25-1416(-)
MVIFASTTDYLIQNSPLSSSPTSKSHPSEEPAATVPPSIVGSGAAVPAPIQNSTFITYDLAVERRKAKPMSPIFSGKTIRWGIAGLGRIAHEFAVALMVAEMEITAVAAGSLPRRKERARIFGDKFGAEAAYNNYEDLARDPNVDIVYVAATNELHRNISLLMFKHGKNVLCEKPTAMTYEEAEEMTLAARKAGVFFATNFWNSAFPAVRFAREALRVGAIGEIVQITGDMGFQTVRNYQDRWLKKGAGGGATMDMGCYLLQFLVMLTEENKTASRLSSMYKGMDAYVTGNKTDLGFSKGDMIHILGAFGLTDPTTKVDIDSSVVVEYKGVQGRFGSSLIRSSPFTVDILGTLGTISIGSPANCPTEATLTAFEDSTKRSAMPFPCCVQPLKESRQFSQELPVYPREYFPQQYPRGTGFTYMIGAVEECLHFGCLELPDVPQITALKVQAATDAIRRRLNADI